MKILVIGSREFRADDSSQHSVRSVNWHEVKKITNLGDYDRVVLLTDTLPQPQNEDVHGISSLLSQENVARIVLHRGHIIVIGDPTRKFVDGDKPKPHGEAKPVAPVSIGELLRLGISSENSPGDNSVYSSYVETPDIVKPYRDYAKHIERWDRILSHPKIDKDWYISITREHFPGVPENTTLDFGGCLLTANRHNAGVALAVLPFLDIPWHYDDQDRYHDGGREILGAIVLLPTLGNDANTSLATLISEVWGIDTKSTVPLWVERMTSPGQEEYDAQILTLDAESQRIAQQRQSVSSSRERCRQPLRLLYAQGTDLEEAVETVFVALGAQPVEMQEGNRADSLFSMESSNGQVFFAIETKGTSKQTFDEKGLRQLNEWTMDCEESLGRFVKGVFVGNSQIGTPPGERELPFGVNFLRTAEVRNYAILLSSDLYRLFEHRHSGNLDLRALVDLIASTGGFVNIEPLIGEGDTPV